MQALVRGMHPSLCSTCESRASSLCPRCLVPRCDAHTPGSAAVRCGDCEAEFQPFRPLNVLLRLPLLAIGAFLGAASGMALALVVSAFLYSPDIEVVRSLAIFCATSGAGVGFASANILATSLLRARFLEERVGAKLPAARALGPGDP